MGIYINPNSKNFQMALNSQIFIDKSLLLRELNALLGTNDRFVCVSRPRRFGKTMAEAMMDAYYSKGCDSKDIFKNLKISKEKGYEEIAGFW